MTEYLPGKGKMLTSNPSNEEKGRKEGRKEERKEGRKRNIKE
jgi:hypothetical protein